MYSSFMSSSILNRVFGSHRSHLGFTNKANRLPEYVIRFEFKMSSGTLLRSVFPENSVYEVNLYLEQQHTKFKCTSN